MLRTLRANNSDARVVALAVFPRGWTDQWHVYDWPSMYKGGIDSLNRQPPCSSEAVRPQPKPWHTALTTLD